jgi:hypothetical protein
MTAISERIAASEIELVDLRTLFGAFINLPGLKPVMVINRCLSIPERQATLNYLTHAVLCAPHTGDVWDSFFKIECEFLPLYVIQHQALIPLQAALVPG